MNTAQRSALFGLIVVCGMTPACQKNSPVAECDCSMFPPHQGCDQKCGIATGIVESVTADTITVKVPVIEPAHTQAGGAEAPAESANIHLRTFTLTGADKAQLANIKPGSRVALTYEEGASQQVLKSIQPIKAAAATPPSH